VLKPIGGAHQSVAEVEHMIGPNQSLSLKINGFKNTSVGHCSVGTNGLTASRSPPGEHVPIRYEKPLIKQLQEEAGASPDLEGFTESQTKLRDCSEQKGTECHEARLHSIDSTE
jgi:hypothetical protein